MRREGLLTGYMWKKNISQKVKVQGKPTNASKLSGRCGRSKCQVCHQSPVSKAMAKTKGRNKRASSLLVDDEWALHARSGKRIPAGRIKAVVSLAIDSDYDDYDDYDAHDACHDVAEVVGHYVYDVDNDSDQPNVDDGGDDVDKTHDDVNDAEVHPHGDVNHASVVMLLSAVAHDDAGHAIVMLPLHALDGENYTDVVAEAKMSANDVIIDDEDGVNHGSRDMMVHDVDDVVFDDDDDDANHGGHAVMVHAADDEDDHAYDQLILQSSMAGFVNVEWCGLRTEEDDEEVSDIESESDWHHVAPSDAIDDWYLC